MKINGKNFKNLDLRHKILAVLAIPAILIGITGLLAFIFSILAIVFTAIIPIAIFKKLKKIKLR